MNFCKYNLASMLSLVILYFNLCGILRALFCFQAYSPQMQPKFERVSAAVKGYLTRRLLKTQKVQDVIKTIDVSDLTFEELLVTASVVSQHIVL